MRRLPGAAALLCTLLAGCSPEMGLLYEGERMPVVDIHLHTGEWEDIPTGTQRFLAERFPFPLGLNGEATAASVLTGEGVLAELDKGGISQALLLSVYAPRSVGVTTNEQVLTQIAADPTRLFGMASLSVDDWDAQGATQLANLEAALAEPNMVGVKLAHAHQHFRMDDPRYYDIYRIAGEANAPVYLHTGPSPFPGTSAEPAYTDPAYLEAAIQAYPDTIFVLGHLGFDFLTRELGALQNCIDLAARYPNVYLEPSAMGSSGSDPEGTKLAEALRRIREAGVADRVIYGSDGPQSPGFTAEYLERTVAALTAAGYSAEEARGVMSGNFYRVYGVEPVVLP